MPLNIAANDITFSGNYSQLRKYGGQGSQPGMNGQGMNGQNGSKLMQINLNNQAGNNQAQNQYMHGPNQTQK